MVHCVIVCFCWEQHKKWKKGHSSWTQSVGTKPRLTSYVTSSPRSASMMKILEIFSQGPYNTRATSGYSPSLRRVLSTRSQTRKACQQKHTQYCNISSDNTSVEKMTYHQTRAPYKVQTLHIYSPPWKTQIKIVLFFLFVRFYCVGVTGVLTLNLCNSRLRTCPVVMELFTRTLVTVP